jgi:hypothetical protein
MMRVDCRLFRVFFIMLSMVSAITSVNLFANESKDKSLNNDIEKTFESTLNDTLKSYASPKSKSIRSVKDKVRQRTEFKRIPSIYAEQQRRDNTQRLKDSYKSLSQLSKHTRSEQWINSLKPTKRRTPTTSSYDYLIRQAKGAPYLSESDWVRAMNGKVSKYMSNKKDRTLLLRHIHQEATHYRINPNLILALIDVESDFKKNVVSHAGAVGLMQIMPFWKKEIGSGMDRLTNIATNIRYGTYILDHYIKRDKGNVFSALSRYNGSYGKKKYPDKVFRAWERHWRL